MEYRYVVKISQQFEFSIDNNRSVTIINKHIFLRLYLEGEPKRLVDGIAVKEETYAQTTNILHARYGDKHRIIQAHVDYLEDLQQNRSDSPEALNSTYIECHRRIEALKAQGENIDVYVRILVRNYLRAFPADVCRRWLIHANREGIPESCITKLWNRLTRKSMELSTLRKYEASLR